MLETSLLREKFILQEASAADGKSRLVASSNRIVLSLRRSNGALDEQFVIRSHNMHGAVRMAARLLMSYQSGGPLLRRQMAFQWKDAWDAAQSEYETSYNPQNWVAVYHNGDVIFEEGTHLDVLNIIEKLQATNTHPYEHSIELAEADYRRNGRNIKISYDGNVALNLTMDEKQARIGVIVRGPLKTMTFNFLVTSKADKPINLYSCMYAAAGFLEGIQLAFMVGMNNEKIRLGLIPASSREKIQTSEASTRLVRLNAEIASLEGSFDVRYRPERPEFESIINDAERLASSMLGPKD